MKDASLHDKLLVYRDDKSVLTDVETSELLIACANILENFLAFLFGIEEALLLAKLRRRLSIPFPYSKNILFCAELKKEVNKVDTFPSFIELNEWLALELKKTPLQSDDKELAIALLGSEYLNEPEQHAPSIEKLVQWCTRALTSIQGQELTKNWPSFNIPQRLDYTKLVETVDIPQDKCGRAAAPESDYVCVTVLTH